MNRPHIVIVTPTVANHTGAATHGNEQTAHRWQRMLQAGGYHVRVVHRWPDKFANQDDILLALHARKSAGSIAAWHALHGGSRLVLALTGTDLYRDIQTDASAQASLAMASRLIVLQDRAPLALPAQHHAKAQVIFQSCEAYLQNPELDKPNLHLRAVMVGHLRTEKSPETLFAAAQLLGADERIYIDHIGAALDAALGQSAQATAKAHAHYRWLGGMAHRRVQRSIGRAHVLVICSQMEGGAHVVMEAVRAGTPVLASRVDGNIGMLGEDYAGYFDWNDAAGLAALLRECRETQGSANGLLASLGEQCARRAPLFVPERERARLLALVGAAL